MTKTKHFISFMFFLFSLNLAAQDLAWLKSSSSNDVFTTHSFYAGAEYNDDFYLAGDFWKDVIIDGFSIEIQEDSPNGFIVKMNEQGTASALWHFKSSNYVRINAIAANTVAESIIITGYYINEMTFDDQTWNSSFTGNGFVMSIYSDGTVDWIREFEAQNNVSFANGTALAVDDIGNVFVGIAAAGTTMIGDQVFSFEAEMSGAVVAEFSQNGELIDSELWENKNFEGWIDITNMEFDDNNDLFITGSTFGKISIGDNSFTFSDDNPSLFILKKDTDFDLKWLKSHESTRSHVLDLVIDENDLILSIHYAGSIDFDGEILVGSGSWGDMALISMDQDGNLNWAQNFTLSENGGNAGVYGLSITPWLDRYFIGGMYQGDVVHDGNLILDNSDSGPSYQYPFMLSISKEGELMSVYDFVGSTEPGRIKTINASDSHLVFGGDFSGQISIEDSTVNTINSALFYGALEDNTTAIDEEEVLIPRLTITPNISSDFIFVETDSEITKFQIISSSGMLLKGLSGDMRILDINDLASGSYYLLAEIDGKISTSQFFKK